MTLSSFWADRLLSEVLTNPAGATSCSLGIKVESVSRIALLEGSAAAKSLVLIVLIDESMA